MLFTKLLLCYSRSSHSRYALRDDAIVIREGNNSHYLRRAPTHFPSDSFLAVTLRRAIIEVTEGAHVGPYGGDIHTRLL